MKKLHKLAAAATATLAVALTPAAHAQSTMDHGKMDSTKAAQTATASDMADGEVRKIDIEAGKVTLKHGEIKSLDMPGMTMVFVVRDKAMLDKLKAGDKVKFKAINDAGKYPVTEIQPAR